MVDTQHSCRAVAVDIQAHYLKTCNFFNGIYWVDWVDFDTRTLLALAPHQYIDTSAIRINTQIIFWQLGLR